MGQCVVQKPGLAAALGVAKFIWIPAKNMTTLFVLLKSTWLDVQQTNLSQKLK